MAVFKLRTFTLLNVLFVLENAQRRLLQEGSVKTGIERERAIWLNKNKCRVNITLSFLFEIGSYNLMAVFQLQT